VPSREIRAHPREPFAFRSRAQGSKDCLNHLFNLDPGKERLQLDYSIYWHLC
jgi:hypothetical protein